MAKATTKITDKTAEEDTKMIVAQQVLIVTAPGGPRRRAGMSFSPVPRELREEDLGEDPEAIFAALRADPLLKIDGRFEEPPTVEREEQPVE